MGAEGSIVKGPVKIVNYTVYNVSDNRVMIYRYDHQGLVAEWQEALGEAAAPDGRVIEATSVYSEIVFQVRSFPGIQVEARRGKLVDIVR